MDLKNSQPFIFLLCGERSGSNFITKLMNNHSEICGPSTKHLINPVARNYFRYQPLESNNQWHSLIDDVLNLYKVKFSVWNTEFTKEELLNAVEYGDVAGLLAYIFNKEVQVNGKKFCFIKEIKTYEFYPFLKKHFANSKYIHLVRDPRDTALSWRKSLIHKGGVIQAARQWKVDQQQFIKIVELEKSPKFLPSFRYEDLVSNTEEVLTSILNSINLKFEKNMLIMDQDSLTNKNAESQKAWENLSKPVMIDNYNKFEKELTSNEIRYIESICYFEMKYLGYEPVSNWEDLKQTTSLEIESYHKHEIAKISYEPVKGVMENMIAKQRFYQHIV
jgi:hypothetical protein